MIQDDVVKARARNREKKYSFLLHAKSWAKKMHHLLLYIYLFNTHTHTLKM